MPRKGQMMINEIKYPKYKGGTHGRRYEGCGAKYHVRIPYVT
jgi:hypothetical protein